MNKTTLTGMLPEEISALLPPHKETYRGMQIFRWIHERGAETFDEMTNLSKEFREEIKDKYAIGALKNIEIRTSSDGSTQKFLWELWDGIRIESVIIRDGGRITACISSQAGCKFGCTFCRTGKMGFIRDLDTGEIIDQLIRMIRFLKPTGEDVSNIVFMGMGEPLDNLDAVLKAIHIMSMETSLEFGRRKITVSTCGIPPGIEHLTGMFKKIGFAISLNAPDDELRSRIMPVNRKYPLKMLLDAARRYTKTSKRRVTFEYILLSGINDSPEHARELLAIARSIPSKVNLIVFNEYQGSHFKQPSEKTVETFQKILFEGNATVMLRKSKGTDILAACGQLASE